jgi:hypothetical protein
MTRRTVPMAVASILVVALAVASLFVGYPLSSLVCVEAVFVVVLLATLRRPVGAGLAWWIVARQPWRPYRAWVSRAEGIALIDLWPTEAPDRSATSQSARWPMRAWAGKRQREQLRSGAFANVWFVGDPTRHGLVVPSGGGTAIFVRHRRVARYGGSTIAAPSAPGMLTGKALERQLQADARRAERRKQASARAAARADAKKAREQEKAARMTPAQRARAAPKEAERAAAKRESDAEGHRATEGAAGRDGPTRGPAGGTGRPSAGRPLRAARPVARPVPA